MPVNFARSILRQIAVILSTIMLAAALAMSAAEEPTGENPFFSTTDYKITNFGWERLSDGAQVAVRVYRPQMKAGPFPAVVIVPPLGRAAIAAPQDRWGRSVAREMDLAEFLAKKGIAAVLFNPPGQGVGDFKSTGSDGRGGYVSQDALGQVLLSISGMGFIDGKNIGVYSEGTGLAIAAGALGRNSEINVRWLIDAEGPWDNLEMSGVTWDKITAEAPRERLTRAEVFFQHKPTSEDNSPENEDWWRRREPKTHAAAMRIKYYQRVQFENDQTQPPEYYAHALRMYEAVRASQIAHLRFNRQEWDAALPMSRVPLLVPGRLDDAYPIASANYILDMAFLETEPPAREIPKAPAPDPSSLPRPFSLY